MRKISCAILLFCFLGGYGQHLSVKESRFSIGLNFSPNFSYRALEYSNESISFVEAREKYEHPSFGFNSGIQFIFKIVNNIEIESGVQFSQQVHKFVEVPLTNIDDENLGIVNTDYKYYYIEVPIKLNYCFNYNQVFVGASIGMSINRFIDDRTKNKIEYIDGTKESVIGKTGIYDFNMTTLATLCGFLVGYNFNEKLNLRVEPLFRYSLTPIAEAPLKQHNYSLGAQIALVMNL